MYRRVLEDKLEFPGGMMFEAMDLLRGVSRVQNHCLNFNLL